MKFVYYGGPPPAMNTVLAIIADSGRAYYFLLKSIDFTKTLR
jgi:hypothetical protein